MQPDPLHVRRIVYDSVVLVDGPWTHRDISANGIRLHMAEAGAGPLVLLLHGFPEFWWSWRHQLTALADAGYHAVAPDLRGYGASDKPPRGYDAPTLAADLAGMVRGRQSADAVVVGHDWGGHLAWSVAALHPEVVRRLVVVSDPASAALARSVAQRSGQRTASRYMLRFQRPWAPERWLVEDDAANVARLLASWGGPTSPTPRPSAGAAMRCRSSTPRTGRWSTSGGRPLDRPRTDGRRYPHGDDDAGQAPTLQLHGALDRCVLPRPLRDPDSTSGGLRMAPARRRRALPPEEAPDAVTGELMRWCGPA